MSWEADIEELRRRQAMTARMGGEEKVARQHANGKLTVRERIDALLDQGSFREIGSVAGRGSYDADGQLVDLSPANFVFGRGRIDGRPVVVGGDDFTVRGGAADASIHEKQVQCEKLAGEYRQPLIRLVDGTGGGGSVKSYETIGHTYVPANPGWEVVVQNLETIPVVALALGSVAGLGAAKTVASHYSLMVKDISQMFIAGPAVVARAGESLTKEELGGAMIHAKAGAVDDVVESEAEAFERARHFLSYLPSSVDELPPRIAPTDDPERRDDWLIKAVPRERRRVYDMRRIVKSVVDQGSFFEMGKWFGRSAITGLARIDGWPVAVLASDPHFYGGGWTADTAQKVVRFVDLADTFHLPVVHLVDIPGFLIGLDAEKTATIRHGARALSAVYQARVPWCTVVIRRAFGVAGAAMMNHTRARYRFAWPSGDWGSLPMEGGIEVAYRAELDKAPDREAAMAEITERLEKVRSPFRSAEAFSIEEIIDPRDTRPLLCEFANLAAPLRRPGFRAAGFRP
ncbi:MAG: methylmalonyl-CoA carboxyltransferase [Tistrella sp.]|uniref:Methylmalonyl-CoA carboxyltransferase n=1 Tax=Tistrella mobilis TaxID=171437 RepID=A0A3B9II04_9PROT|nr:methylmalonyl-CoA carboxyltransferase [Tistrella sp.]HAE46927.1 methylmalonyl-CoA carboxyltransferase [Tistrella mobilis]